VSGEPKTSNFPQDLPRWPLLVAAGICLVVSIGLAIADREAAGTLAAGLFVVCALLNYLPQMESFKAYGIEAKMRATDVLANEAKLKNEIGELKAKIPPDAPKATLEAVKKVDETFNKLSTANNEFFDLVVSNPPFKRGTILNLRQKLSNATFDGPKSTSPSG
jgi:hypothetical protein